jgi:hypothetical protein
MTTTERDWICRTIDTDRALTHTMSGHWMSREAERA